MNKAIATNVILLLLAGTVIAGVATYRVYTTLQTTQEFQKETECINLRRDYCQQWSRFDFDPASQPTWWDPDCGNILNANECKSILGLPVEATTTSTTTTTGTSMSTTTSTIITTTTTIPPSDCDSQCKASGYASGVCRSGGSSTSFFLYRYKSIGGSDSAADVAEYLDMSQSWEYTGSKIQEIHSIRPDYKALFYRNVKAVYPYWTDEWDLFRVNNWVLKDVNGNYVYSTYYGPSNYMFVDIGNPDYQQWVANKIKEVLNEYGFNGVFADEGLYVTSTWGSASGDPINPRTGTYWTDEEVKQAYLGLHQKIKQTIGSKLLVANGIWRGIDFYNHQSDYTEVLQNSPMDGFMSEGIWYTYNGYWFSEDYWKRSLDFLIWTQDNYLDSNKYFVPVCSHRNNPSGVSDYRLSKYCTASLLLGIKAGQKQIYFHNGDIEFLKTYGSRLFDKVNSIGDPLGNYYIDNVVYVRDFSNGKVLVNPTSTNYIVNLGGNYETLDGEIVSSIAMNSHTGEVLFKTTSSEHWGVYQRDPGWAAYAQNYGLPQIELLEASGLNLVVVNINCQAWNDNEVVTGPASTGLPYKDHLKFLVDEARKRGIDTVFTRIGVNSSENINTIRTPSSREAWIVCAEEMVEYCDPYAMLPFEEPMAKSWWNEQPDKWEMTIDYNEFIMEYIDRIRAIKPNMRMYVMPFPYSQDGLRIWYEDTLTRYGTHGLPRSNIVYLASGYPYYPAARPGDGSWRDLYWDATTQADLDVARQSLYDMLDWKWGDAITNLKMLMVAGVVDYRTLPDQDYNMGATACMVDAFNWAKTYDHELVIFDMRGPNTGDGTYAIQTPTELGWNNLGQLLVDNAPTIEGGCLSEETSIGQVGCSSGQTCCCSGTIPKEPVFQTDFEDVTKVDDRHLSISINHNFNFEGTGGARMWVEGFDEVTSEVTCHSGSRCLGMELYDIDKVRRNEFNILNMLDLTGNEYSVSAWYYFPTDFTLYYPGITWNYFEFNVLFSQMAEAPCGMWVPYLKVTITQPDFTKQEFSVSVGGRDPECNQYTADQIDNFPLPLGRWFNVKYHLIQHPTNGAATVWVDGMLISNRTDFELSTVTDHFKIQPAKIYHNPDDHTQRKIWLDDLKIYKGALP